MKKRVESENIARGFLKKLLKSDRNVVGLSGDLGTGKTAFTQMVAKLLGIKRKVNSPTFVIIKKYPIEYNKYKFLFHLDAYRLKNEKELLYLGWKEIMADPTHLIFIEWPERVAKIMPKKYHKIIITHAKNGGRCYKIA